MATATADATPTAAATDAPAADAPAAEAQPAVQAPTAPDTAAPATDSDVIIIDDNTGNNWFISELVLQLHSVQLSIIAKNILY